MTIVDPPRKAARSWRVVKIHVEFSVILGAKVTENSISSGQIYHDPQQAVTPRRNVGGSTTVLQVPGWIGHRQRAGTEIGWFP